MFLCHIFQLTIVYAELIGAVLLLARTTGETYGLLVGSITLPCPLSGTICSASLRFANGSLLGVYRIDLAWHLFVFAQYCSTFGAAPVFKYILVAIQYIFNLLKDRTSKANDNSYQNGSSFLR